MAVYQVCTDSLTIFTAQPTVLLTRSVLNQLTGLWVPLSVCVCLLVCVFAWLFSLSFFASQLSPAPSLFRVNEDCPSCISAISLPQITQSAVL